jgi:hypothetical protein
MAKLQTAYSDVKEMMVRIGAGFVEKNKNQWVISVFAILRKVVESASSLPKMLFSLRLRSQTVLKARCIKAATSASSKPSR